MFYGTYRATMDDKNRMRIPLKFRVKLGDSFMLGAGTGKSLFVIKEDEFENMMAIVDAVPYSSLEQQDAVRMITSRLCEPTEDEQGRFLLPQELKKHANIKKKVVFLGVKNRIEIWAEEEFDQKFFASGASIDDAVKQLAEFGL